MIHTGSKREWGQMEREGRSVDLVRTCRLDIITLIAHGHEEKKTDLPLLCRGSNFQSNVERSPGLLCDWSKNSPPKLKPITTWLPAFSRTLGSLVGFTSSSHWLFKVFSSLPIGCCDNFSVSRYSIEKYSISHDVSGSRKFLLSRWHSV